KHIVTANKDVIAEHGAELLKLAKDQGCDLFYEASVGGGIPIIRSLKDGFASDKITKMMGIVNGTTNYILTKMSQEGMSYEMALAKAQALGFAEPDPTSDVEGLDAARKILILAKLGFSMNLELADVYTVGISGVTSEDIEYTKQLGFTLKLIGLASRENGAVEVSVQPTLLPNAHPLASVHNEYNAVYVCGEAVGETMFYGPGAGGLPTATSIVSDIVAVVKNMRLGVNGAGIATLYNPKSIKRDVDMFSKFFMRIKVQDQPGVFLKLASIFYDNQLSLESILQKPCIDGAEVIIITHLVSLENFVRSLYALNQLDVVIGVKSCYRVVEM
ncbi:MAG: homoserine dehydrogenase, partial [Vallitaleaceae bacterium]|nr:homoserine dehydrogenase [Vallitaleaceae bacterium]